MVLNSFGRHSRKRSGKARGTDFDRGVFRAREVEVGRRTEDHNHQDRDDGDTRMIEREFSEVQRAGLQLSSEVDALLAEQLHALAIS